MKLERTKLVSVFGPPCNTSGDTTTKVGEKVSFKVPVKIARLRTTSSR